jgi:hypothetical protein
MRLNGVFAIPEEASSMKTKIGKVWLVTRGPGPFLSKHEILDILSARKSLEDIRKYVQRLHNLQCLTLRERAERAGYNSKSDWPYEAEVFPFADRTAPPQIHCGHDPYYIARLVRNLTMDEDQATGHVTFAFEETNSN